MSRHNAVTHLDGVNLPTRAARHADNVRRVLVLQHHPDEDPGALGALLEGAGIHLGDRGARCGRGDTRTRPLRRARGDGRTPARLGGEGAPLAGRREGGRTPLGGGTGAALPRRLPRAPAGGRRAGRDGQGHGRPGDRRQRHRAHARGHRGPGGGHAATTADRFAVARGRGGRTTSRRGGAGSQRAQPGASAARRTSDVVRTIPPRGGTGHRAQVGRRARIRADAYRDPRQRPGPRGGSDESSDRHDDGNGEPGRRVLETAFAISRTGASEATTGATGCPT